MYQNLNLVAVTLNDGNDFIDHKNLFEYGFNNFYKLNILSKGNLSIHDSIYYGKYELSINNNFDYVLDSDDKLYINFELSEKPQEGKCGMVKVYLNNNLIYKDDIYSRKIKRKKKFWEKLW